MAEYNNKKAGESQGLCRGYFLNKRSFRRRYLLLKKKLTEEHEQHTTISATIEDITMRGVI